MESWFDAEQKGSEQEEGGSQGALLLMVDAGGE